MNPDTVNRLLELNRQFYQTFARQFSATRQRLQPGVKRILKRIPPTERILDLGCGNGELWRSLARGGHRGAYVGLDFSFELLAVATAGGRQTYTSAVGQTGNRGPQDLTAGMPTVTFLQADLSAPDWSVAVPNSPFDIILAFAVLHHIPSHELRLQILRKAHDLLNHNGRFIHSEWQFLNSPRLRARIQPWKTVDLSNGLVDPGDYLLDWRHGGYGLRYVHHFTEAELVKLAEESGFLILETFLSDGEGGSLGLYQVWEKS